MKQVLGKVVVFCGIIALLAGYYFLSYHPKQIQKNKKLAIFPHAQIVGSKTTFKINEPIRFSVKLNEPVAKSPLSFIPFVHAEDIPVRVTVQDKVLQKNINANDVILTQKSDNSYDVSINSSTSHLRPGSYTLMTTLQKDGQIKILSQDFSYGVLAINTNKSVYTPNEIAYLQMAVLDSDGHTLCHARLKLEIQNPKRETTTLSTDDKTIHESDTCGADNVTDSPDYFVHYQTTTSGTYTMTLKNLDENTQITDSFEVKDSVPFVVERTAATRINPFISTYMMHIKITANQNFNGEVDELIPGNFEVKSQNAKIKTTTQNSKVISWNVNLKSGDSTELDYTYQAPKSSPDFFLLAPLSIGNVFKEPRQWQLASDSACQSNATGNWSAAGTWTNCAGGIPGSGDTVEIRSPNTVTVDASESAASVTIDVGGTLTFANTPTLTLTATTGTLLTNNGTYTANGETISITSNAAVTLFSGTFTGANALNTLSMTPTITSGRTYTMGAAVTTGGDFTINPSAASSLSLTVNMSGAIIVDSAHTVTVTGNGAGPAVSTLDTVSGQNYSITMGLLSVGGTVNKLQARASTVKLTGTSGTLISLANLSGIATTGTIEVTSDGSVTFCGGTSGCSNIAFGTLTFDPTLTNDRTYTMGTAFASDTAWNITPSAGSSHLLTVNASGSLGSVNSSTSTLSISPSGSATATLAAGTNSLTIGTLTIGTNGTFTSGNVSNTYKGTGTVITNNGTYTKSSGTDNFSGNGNTTIVSGSGSTTFNHVTIAPLNTLDETYTLPTGVTMTGNLLIEPIGGSSKTLTANMSGPLTLSGTLECTPGNNSNCIFDTTTNNYALTAGALDTSPGTTNSNATMNLNASTITLTTGLSGSYIVSNSPTTWNYGTSTIIMNADAALSIAGSTGSTTVDLYNVTINPTITAARSPNYTSSVVNLNIHNNLTISPNAATSQAYTITLQNGNGVVTGTTSLAPTGSATVTFDTKSGSNFAFSTGKLNIGSGSTVTAQAATLTLTGTSGTILTRTGTFTQGTSTVDFSNSTGDTTLTSGTVTFNNLSLDMSGHTGTLGNTITVNNNLAINSGTLADGGNQITGNATGTLTAAAGSGLSLGSSGTATTFPTSFTSGNITLNKTSTVSYVSGQNQTVSSTPSSYGNLTVAGVSGTPTMSLAAATTLTGGLTIGSGTTLDTTASNFNMTVGGNWANSGTFTAHSGTVTFNDNTQTSSITGNTTFNNFTATTQNKILAFGVNNTQTVSGTLTLTGASGNDITLQSVLHTAPWKLKSTGTASISFVQVSDSNACSGNSITPTNSINLGDNFCWIWSGHNPTNIQRGINIHQGVNIKGT